MKVRKATNFDSYTMPSDEFKAALEKSAPAAWEVEYGYGERIIHNGRFELSNAEYDDVEKEDFVRGLGTEGSPIGIVQTKVVEVNEQTGSKIAIPMRLLQKGEVFGAYERADERARAAYGKMLQPPALAKWDLTAGSISCIMHTNPRTLRSQLSKHFNWSEREGNVDWRDIPYVLQQFDPDAEPWSCKVLILSREAFHDAAIDLAIADAGWHQTAGDRNEARLFRFIAREIDRVKKGGTHKNQTALARALVKIWKIATGDLPSFEFQENSNTNSGPFEEFIEAIRTETNEKDFDLFVPTYQTNPDKPALLIGKAPWMAPPGNKLEQRFYRDLVHAAQGLFDVSDAIREAFPIASVTVLKVNENGECQGDNGAYFKSQELPVAEFYAKLGSTQARALKKMSPIKRAFVVHRKMETY